MKKKKKERKQKDCDSYMQLQKGTNGLIKEFAQLFPNIFSCRCKNKFTMHFLSRFLKRSQTRLHSDVYQPFVIYVPTVCILSFSFSLSLAYNFSYSLIVYFTLFALQSRIHLFVHNYRLTSKFVISFIPKDKSNHVFIAFVLVFRIFH